MARLIYSLSARAGPASSHAFSPSLLQRAGKFRALTRAQPRRTFTTNPRGKSPDFAFAFDIDGVLLHVAKPIPGASATLQYLQKNNIPFILLTNGGGKHEKDRVADLSDKLGVKLSTENFVQSHTPFQQLVHGNGTPGDGLANKNILVTGADASKSRDIAEAYGFKSVITPADILMAQPTIWPFEPLMEELYARTARPLPPSSSPGGHLQVDAMFVFNDPRDWALDTQIIIDLLLSSQGNLGTYSSRNGDASLGPTKGWQDDGQPPLYFSNPDLFWAASYHHPRLGQGAFQAALAGIWDQITDGASPLQRTVIGKPYRQTYRYAERVLNAHRANMLSSSAASTGPLSRVYMVGDNPESDIRGANEYQSTEGTDWNSILVRTGVWDSKRGGAPKYEPKAVADDVKGAVEWALKNEGWS